MGQCDVSVGTFKKKVDVNETLEKLNIKQEGIHNESNPKTRSGIGTTFTCHTVQAILMAGTRSMITAQ